jgi:hypothetical protein
MNRTFCLTCVAVLVCAFASVCRQNSSAQIQRDNRAPQPEQNPPVSLAPALDLAEFQAALPSEAQLKARGFGAKYRVTEFHSDDPAFNESEIKAVRVRDGLEVKFVVSVSATVDGAKRYVANEIRNNPHGMLRGVPSSRKIAEEAWRPRYLKPGPPRGAFSLLARDGRSSIRVSLSYPKTRKDEMGNWVSELFPQSELMMTETFLIQTLRELTNLGYTSRSTPAQRAAADQRAAAKAAADKAAANTAKPGS